MPLSKPLDTTDLRRLNMQRILLFLRGVGAAARSEIATGTGLSRAAITGLLGPLLTEGYVEEVADTLKVGRPSPKIRLARGRRAVLTGELTVDDFRVHLTDLSGQLMFEKSNSHAGLGGTPEQVLGVGRELFKDALAWAADMSIEVVGSTAIIPAPVSADMILVSSDFGWENVPARQILTQELPQLAKELQLVNDALVGAHAEYLNLLETQKKPPRTMIYLKADTGIGGGVMHEGERFEGGSGLAFIITHHPLDPNGPTCCCGARGCFVALAGPLALLENAGLSALGQQIGVGPAVERLIERAASGDRACQDALHAAASVVARFLLSAQYMYDPDAVVLGGYWQHIVAAIKEEFRDSLNPAAGPLALGHKTELLPAHHGTRANRVGATDHLIHQHLSNLETLPGVRAEASAGTT